MTDIHLPVCSTYLLPSHLDNRGRVPSLVPRTNAQTAPVSRRLEYLVGAKSCPRGSYCTSPPWESKSVSPAAVPVAGMSILSSRQPVRHGEPGHNEAARCSRRGRAEDWEWPAEGEALTPLRAFQMKGPPRELLQNREQPLKKDSAVKLTLNPDKEPSEILPITLASPSSPLLYPGVAQVQTLQSGSCGLPHHTPNSSQPPLLACLHCLCS